MNTLTTIEARAILYTYIADGARDLIAEREETINLATFEQNMTIAMDATVDEIPAKNLAYAIRGDVIGFQRATGEQWTLPLCEAKIETMLDSLLWAVEYVADRSTN